MSNKKQGRSKNETASSPFASLKELKDKIAAAETAGPKKPAPILRTAPKQTEAETCADDELAFHRLMDGVTPLSRDNARIPQSTLSPMPSEIRRDPATQKERAQAADLEAESVRDHLRALVSGADSRFEVTDDGHYVAGRRADVGGTMLRKLRSGAIPAGATLDLHGMRAHEARDALGDFLRKERAIGERCVLIIHGKGVHSPRGDGILRGEIAAWLSQGAASEHVSAFATAVGGDGGAGATYVLLRAPLIV